MWHAFGDPTLEMWTRNPHRITLDPTVVVSVLQDRIEARYTVEGAELTALQLVEGEPVPIGRAVVKGGVADIEFFAKPVEQVPIFYSASLENATSVALKETTPPPPPIP
jgi:hypothetical protein